VVNSEELDLETRDEVIRRIPLIARMGIRIVQFGPIRYFRQPRTGPLRCETTVAHRGRRDLARIAPSPTDRSDFSPEPRRPT